MTKSTSLQLSSFFTEAYLREYFEEKLRSKKGGGRDHLSPEKFYERYEGQFAEIAEKCVKGKYRFSYYREMLVLKGRDKYPRVLAIPSVRDRLVLGVLNRYLQAVYPDAARMPVPNKIVSEICEYLCFKEGDVNYLKTDFHDFYGSIVKQRLMDMLAGRIKDTRALRLVKSAIETPVVPDAVVPRKIKRSYKGIAQGLPISNILANIYMMGFDKSFGRESAVKYFRYVDDILYLDPKSHSVSKDMKNVIKQNRLGLKLAVEKNSKGNIRIDSFDYLGYAFKGYNGHVVVSARKTKVSQFLNRIAGIISKCQVEYRNVAKRQDGAMDDGDFCRYYIDELNILVNGFKSGGHLYGWMAYYQGITDMQQLYSMDYHIKKMVSAHKQLPEEICQGVSSLVAAYYDIKGNSGNKVMLNLDNYKTVEDKRAFLKQRRKRGVDSFDDKQIEIAFSRYVDSLIRHTQMNIGEVS